MTLVESTTDDGGFLSWRRSGENLPHHPWWGQPSPTRGGWRKEERLSPSHARGGDALPLPVEEEGSFHELRLSLNFPRTVLKRIGKVENLYKLSGRRSARRFGKRSRSVRCFAILARSRSGLEPRITSEKSSIQERRPYCGKWDMPVIRRTFLPSTRGALRLSDFTN